MAVTYAYPVSGSTAPTQTQASQVPTVTGLVTFVDSDTTALFTHNFGISTGLGFAGIQPGILSYFPEVILYCLPGAGTIAPTLGVVLTSGNAITISKGSILGSACSVVVTVRKPHSTGL